MPEQSHNNDDPKTTKRKNKRVWLGIIVVLTLMIVCYLLFLRNSQSADEQLAEIEAARAIPDSENAATIYNELLAKNEKILLHPDFLGEDADRITMRLPWTAADHPNLAKWIKGRQPTIDGLLHASSFDKCRFPIADYTDPRMLSTVDRFPAMRGWTYLLARAANNDIAQGRTDDAIAKYRCVIQLARHLYQQPIIVEHLVGIAIEAIGLQSLYRLLIETDLTETQIKVIEQFQPTTRDNWADVLAETLEVEKLLSKKMYHPLARLKEWWSGMSIGSLLKHVHDIHLRTVSGRRALKIIIELRRYKNKHAHWPKTLDEIKSSLPEEALIDSINDSSFVYRLADDTFELYSKGKNRIDEDGQRNVTFDPNTYESIEHEDDRLFWPLKMPKNNEEDTDDK